VIPRIQKIDALLAGLTRKDLEGLTQAQKQRLAAALRLIADLADLPKPPPRPKSGVLYDLKHGKGRE
jgi:hypothetical protein